MVFPLLHGKDVVAAAWPSSLLVILSVTMMFCLPCCLHVTVSSSLDRLLWQQALCALCGRGEGWVARTGPKWLIWEDNGGIAGMKLFLTLKMLRDSGGSWWDTGVMVSRPWGYMGLLKGQETWRNFSNFSVSIVHADGVEPFGARPSPCTVTTSLIHLLLVPHIYVNQLSQHWVR